MDPLQTFQLGFAIRAAQDPELFFDGLAGFVATDRIKHKSSFSHGRIRISFRWERVDPEKEALGIKRSVNSLLVVDRAQAIEQAKGRMVKVVLLHLDTLPLLVGFLRVC